MHQLMCEKYQDTEYVNKVMITDIIKNKPTHLSSLFKEYLVFDEPIEFLKRYYSVRESKARIKKLNKYHATYFKVFPNFIMLKEKYYMYKNIERKQRAIDEIQYRGLMQDYTRKSPEMHYESQNVQLFNESYKNHLSSFRSNFEKEQVTLGKVDINKIFGPGRLSSRNNARGSKIDHKTENSIEAVLSKVNTSCMQQEQVDIGNTSSLSFFQNPDLSSLQISLIDSPIEEERKQTKRKIYERRNKVFDATGSREQNIKKELTNEVDNISCSENTKLPSMKLQSIDKIKATPKDASINHDKNGINRKFKRSVIEISDQLLKKHMMSKKRRAPTNSPDYSQKVVKLLHQSTNSQIDNSLRSRLQNITSVKNSPVRKIIPYSMMRPSQKSAVKHSRENSVSRNVSLKKPSKHCDKLKASCKRSKQSFGSKSRDTFQSHKGKFHMDIDKTINNVVVFMKKKTKKLASHKRIKNKRIISYIGKISHGLSPKF